jgi:hypothetical protein
MNFNENPTANDTAAVPVPAGAPVEPVIACGEFWPAINPADCRLAMRLDGTVTPERLREALIAAITQVQDTLAAWTAQQATNGHATLAATTAQTVDGKNVNVWRFTRAVYCYAAANVQERMRGFDTTGDGHQRADALTDPIDEHRRDGQWAVSDIMGRGRTVVELI